MGIAPVGVTAGSPSLGCGGGHLLRSCVAEEGDHGQTKSQSQLGQGRWALTCTPFTFTTDPSTQSCSWQCDAHGDHHNPVLSPVGGSE